MSKSLRFKRDSLRAGLLALVLIGCDGKIVKTEYSPILQEKGYVVDTIYSDSYHGTKTDLVPTVDFEGNVGIDTVTVTVDIPKKYGVVFRCEHEKKFVISGPGKKYKDLWDKLDPQMDVIIDYKEIYESTYQDLNNDGEKELIEKKLTDYDFIDANPN